MPAADTTRARRSTRLLPTTLFWAGVALAPLAVLVFLVSTGAFAMQIAAVLAVAALALMGVALWLSRDGDNVRVEVEEIVFEELDAMRGDIRNDIAHATRTSHKQLGERIAALNATVDSLRGQLDYVRGQLERAGQPQSHQAGPAHHSAPSGVPGGLLRHTETVQVTTRQTTLVDSSDGRRDGNVYGSRPQPNEYGTRPQPAEYGSRSGEYGGRARVDYPPPTDNGVPSHFGGRATVPPPRQELPRPEPPRQEPARPEPRTEPRFEPRLEPSFDARTPSFDARLEPEARTSSFEPRTDPRPEPRPEPRTGDVPGAFGGRSYGAAQVPLQRAPEPSYSPPPPSAIDAGPREESWTEQLLRERLGRREHDRIGRDDGDWEERTSGGRRRAFDPGDYSDERTTGGLSSAGTTGYRTSDRWAEVRSDERGRELQMGEFRSQMRESERGSEYRIEDRWAAVLREDERRRHEERSDGERPRRSPASRERERSRALPPAPAEPPPSWASGWANAGRDEEPTYRWNEGREPDGRLPRRIVDFEHTDDRWR